MAKKEAKAAPKPVPVAPGELKAIKEAKSAVDSFIATVQWMQNNQTIDGDTAGRMIAGLNHRRDELEPALVANVNN